MYFKVLSSTFTMKPQKSPKFTSAPEVKEKTTVNLNLTIPEDQYMKIVEVRKKKHMLSDQDLIRMYITMGLEQSI